MASPVTPLSPPPPAAQPNLLIVSDVHLSRLRPMMAPGGQGRFGPFLEHYATQREGGRPWRLIVNGDLLDFDHQADSIRVRGREADSLTLFEGIEAASRGAFVGFARFLEAGNEVVVIPGNHDRDLLWPRVRQAFVEAIAVHLADRAVLQRLTFQDWFYYEPGRIYLEHGHQYECDTGLVGMLDPFEAGEPATMRSDLATWWIADFCPHIPEIAYHVDHTRSPLYYLPIVARAFAWKAPVIWMKLLWFIWRTLRSAGPRHATPGPRHVTRREELARASGLSVEQLQRVEAVMAPPRLASRLRTAARLHALPVLLLPAIVGLAIGGGVLGSWALGGAALALTVAMLAVNVFVSSRYAGHIVAGLRRAAGQLQAIVGTPFVALGHNHTVTDEPAGQGRYLNSGTWADPRFPCSFLRVVGMRAEVAAWTGEETGRREQQARAA